MVQRRMTAIVHDRSQAHNPKMMVSLKMVVVAAMCAMCTAWPVVRLNDAQGLAKGAVCLDGCADPSLDLRLTLQSRNHCNMIEGLDLIDVHTLYTHYTRHSTHPLIC